MNLGTPFVPQGEDGVLRVIIPGRISTAKQDMESIASQQEDAAAWVRRVYTGAVEIRQLGEQASGWLVNRETMVEIEELMSTGDWDAVIVTELREVYRNPALQWGFVQSCLDNDVRFISIADNIDTTDENWEVMMHTATLRHGMTVPEVRRRVRRKAAYTFSRGGMVLKVKYGYRKLTKEEATSGQFGTAGLRIVKRSECTPTIREIRDRVIRGDSYVAVADWLNDEEVPPGPYVEHGRWTARVVKDLLRDPVLSGRRQFRATVHKLVYKTGKHRTEHNPAGPEVKEHPELAHLSDEEHATVLAIMDARKAAAGQRPGRDNPLWRVPRKRSLWPGQHATCGACGGRMYRYGRFLRCQHTFVGRPRTCWNHVQIDYATIRSKVLPWIVGVLNGWPGFRAMLVQFAWTEVERGQRQRRRSGRTLDDRVGDLESQAGRLAKAIALGGNLDALVSELSKVQGALIQARDEQARRADNSETTGGFKSAEDVAARLDDAVEQMAQTSREFAALLRRLVPEFVIQPVQQLDCPQVRARAKLTLRLDAWAAGPGAAPEATVTLDLFEPPLHIRHLQACLTAKQARPDATLKQIAAELTVNHMTVKRAVDYARRMDTAGLTEPYRELREQPATASRWTKQRRGKRAGPSTA